MAKDPGKTLQTAKLFRLGQTARTLKDNLSAQDRIDIWKFNLTTRSSFNLNLKGIAKKANANVDLLSATGRVLQSSSKRGNKPESLNNIPLELGTFYVRIKLQQNTSTRYALTLSATPSSDQFSNSFETATSLRTATGTVTDFVGNSDPNDFLKFGTLVAGQLNVGLTGLTEDANLEVYDGNRNLIFTSNNSGTADEAINQRLTSLSGSTYYIRVVQAPGKDANYTLNYSFVADTPIRTTSGLQYIDVTEGTGATPKTGQTVTVNYTGILLDGTKFDSSFDRNRPFSFQIGVGDVIQGWDEGISSMKVGGRRQLIIPSALAYGSQSVGEIPPNSTLVFDVEMLGIS